MGTVRTLKRGSSDYPDRLEDMARAGLVPPGQIHVAGELGELDRCDCIVRVTGSRRARPEDLETVRNVTEHIAMLNVVGARAGGAPRVGIVAETSRGTLQTALAAWLDTMDGLRARGVDAERLPAPIVAVATGIDVEYPRGSMELEKRVLAAGGAIVTREPDGEPAVPANFRAKQALAAALADLTLATTAGVPSGIVDTCDNARDMGRAVCALPGKFGDPWTSGTNALIAQGARCIDSFETLDEEIAKVARGDMR